MLLRFHRLALEIRIEIQGVQMTINKKKSDKNKFKEFHGHLSGMKQKKFFYCIPGLHDWVLNNELSEYARSSF